MIWLAIVLNSMWVVLKSLIAYQELCDGQELTRRFAENNKQRQLIGKPIIEDDTELLAVIDDLPRCAGVALGIDRLTMALRGLEDIAGV